MTIAEFNSLTTAKQTVLLTRCCGSSEWVNKMIAALPLQNLDEFKITAQEKWFECKMQDWLEAFGHHPKIGDLNSLKEKFASTVAWASNEQSAVNAAAGKTLENLAKGNEDYEKKFGYIFIVCATGKSAEEMLSLLELRLLNKPADEIKIAAAEQDKITKLRLDKLFA